MSIENKVKLKLKEIGIVLPNNLPNKVGCFGRIKQHYLMMLSSVFPDIDPFFALRNKLHSFGYAGQNVRVRSGMKCSNPENIFLFDEAFINYNCTILAKSPVVIGKRVAIGPNVSFYTVDHRLDTSNLRFTTHSSPIIVEDYSWIGGNCIIVPGRVIGRSSVIGAGSVVTHDTEEGWLYVGNPARKVKKVN